MTTDLLGAQAAIKKRDAAPWDAVNRGQQQLMGAVTGYGELLRPELLQTIGTALGGLNSIGALRSGATTTALGDIAGNYADRVGAYAATTAAQGADLGLNVYDRLQQEKARRQAQRASMMRTLGSALGAGIGFAVGGPVGAKVGSQLGGAGATVIDNNGGDTV